MADVKTYTGYANERAEQIAVSYVQKRTFADEIVAAGAIATFDRILDSQDVAPCSERGAVGSGITLKTEEKSVSVPRVLLVQAITDADMMQRAPGTIPYSEDPRNLAVWERLKVERASEQIARLETMMCVQAMREGKVDFIGAEGTAISSHQYWTGTYQSPNPADPCITAPALAQKAPGGALTATAANVFGVLEQIRAAQSQKGGQSADTLYVAPDVAEALLMHEEIQRTLQASRMNFGDLRSPVPFEDGVRSLGYLYGFEIIILSGTYKGGGSFTYELMPSGTAIACSRGRNQMFYGSNLISIGGRPVQQFGRLAIGTGWEANPPALMTQVASSPMPIIRRLWDNVSVKGLVVPTE